jgi:hypothetical protein
MSFAACSDFLVQLFCPFYNNLLGVHWTLVGKTSETCCSSPHCHILARDTLFYGCYIILSSSRKSGVIQSGLKHVKGIKFCCVTSMHCTRKLEKFGNKYSGA